ncbi:hypothetical protein L917_05058 [Phytophthora nicotianae]|uniref:Uncharacterized protein n=1 Tax=Phytophthora nicotianae TaxID=4792 RepID=W2LJZ9_PHYNI|nr:hypothetical protein L917_05058 [Phytophthora nicotianae]
MDVILSRAGLNPTQQRSLCLDAVMDEVKQTEVKLTDAIASLKRLQDVVRVARDVHNAQRSVVTLPSDAEASVKGMAQSSEQIGPVLRDIQCMLNAFTISSRSRGSSGYSTEDEDEEQLTLPANHERVRQQYRETPASGPYRSSGLGSSGWIMNPHKGGPAPSFFRVRDQGRTGELPTPRTVSGAISSSASYDISSDGLASGPEYVGQKRRATSLAPPIAHSFLRPTTTVDLMIRRELERQSVWPRHHQYRLLHSRPRSPVQQSEKKVAQVIDGLEKRLSKLSGAEQHDVISASIKSALKVARLTKVKGEEESVQIAVNNARAASSALLDRDSSCTDILDRLEDLRQILAVVVRAALETDGKLEGSGLRDLLKLLKNLQDTFPGSAARFKWYVSSNAMKPNLFVIHYAIVLIFIVYRCSTQLRKFITQKYKRPAQTSVIDQEKLSSVVAEARKWESVNDYTASRFGDIMTFVMEILEGSYEEWEPREDSQLAELIGIMIIRLGAFRDSHVQQGRLHDVHGWLYKMSGTSFSPSLDLKSMPPPHMTGIYVTPNKGFRTMEDVEEGFHRLSKAKATKSFGFLTMTSYTFLATVLTTQNPKLLPINELTRFNENLQVLKELDVEGERWAILQSYQVLEKVLYLMRVLMHQRPEYLESSAGTVDALLALFPPSKRPIFVYPSSATALGSNLESGNENFVDELSDD